MAAGKHFFIINPVAGMGKAKLWWENMGPALLRLGENSEFAFTEDEGTAPRQVREAIAKGFDTIVAIGGDGTAHEVLNGIMSAGAGSLVAMLPWPAGTGCDLARSLYPDLLDRDLPGLLMGGQRQSLDCIHLAYTGKDGTAASRWCFNVTDVGFSADVAHYVNSWVGKKRGKTVFAQAAIAILKKHKNIHTIITVDGEPFYNGDMTLAAFGNGGYIGGGMNVCPTAHMSDGFLEVMVAKGLKRWQILWHMPAFFQGKHVRLPFVKHCRGKTTEISTMPPRFIDADGECIGLTPLKLHLEVGKVAVLLP